MVKITWKIAGKDDITADIPIGNTLMEAAVDNNVPFIEGECGGCLSCATCHVFVDPDWYGTTGAPGDFEEDMLDMTEVERSPTSRLSCQITASTELDGLVLHVPIPD
ncbi:MAG: 2Fe-2S iron-sulfur cluster binding domain-containing protein [Gammaproteobacteria bacterium]|nr:2Fe-2S iron-sulfur cluster binding domain-containing protein [Gammaproteobacteria bacterium]MYD77066.1 2Fe-2S iron-sulfur cluster binding domain-containing protein [Gammaproteobacteria bacterium]MYJ52237.1 2Fe-2S iron-sulfur cluster binding domain-containing protein [Gammaproteobacteria bacterium]